ncbi:MAG: DNA recombination/repair protein RecA, partial [Bacteroidales bacterium]|nr:DNA recombination/repair protein RecA [Bacteroidales bacterium]
MAKENNTENTEKLKVLNATLERLEKVYGKGAIMKLGDKPSEGLEVIPSGSIGLDIALGVNGLPKGRVVEIFGPESSG